MVANALNAIGNSDGSEIGVLESHFVDGLDAVTKGDSDKVMIKFEGGKADGGEGFTFSALGTGDGDGGEIKITTEGFVIDADDALRDVESTANCASVKGILANGCQSIG